MTLFQDTGGDPRAARSVIADVLAWYGAVGDAAMGNPPGFALRKASVAVQLARTAGVTEDETYALYFAGMLHAIGAIGNRAFRKGERLPERIARMESWDVPAQGAQLCAKIAGLPAETPDLVRWQSESWDGTGYPDQLRWQGIPKSAQLLHLGDRFARSADPEEALGAIGMESGSTFGPEHVRAFTMWFHMHGGEAKAIATPLEAMHEPFSRPDELIDLFADRIDAHNAVSGRWRRVAEIAVSTAAALALGEARTRNLAVACRLYGAGEIGSAAADDAFDPLARLGMEQRAREAVAASALAAPHPALSEPAKIVSARGEWFDGSGKPRGLARKELTKESGILAAAIAYDRLERKERIETAAGLQFDPAIVRAVMGAGSRA